MFNDKERHGFLHGKELYESIVGDHTGDANVFVWRLLIGLGFKSRLIGTGYLQDAILCRYEKADVVHVNYTHDIYDVVAIKQNTCATCVERSIRCAIIDCKKYGNLYALNELLHTEVVTDEYVPSNTEFISCVVGWLQAEKEQEHIK